MSQHRSERAPGSMPERGGPRVFYAAGPGNVIGTFRHWKQGCDDPSQIAITYSGQFYDAIRDTGATSLVIASCRVPGRISDGPFHIEHRAVPFDDFNGPLYHLGQIWYGLGLLVSAIRFRSDVAVVCGGTHWFMLTLLSLAGIPTIASVHCTLWRDHPSKSQIRNDLARRIVRRLDGWFFRRRCDAVLSVSTEVTRQIRTLCGDREPRQMHTFVPIYRRSAFADVVPAPRDPSARRPFRVLFVGRVERNKGVFDLKSIARRFAAEGRTDIEFDLCGTGAAIDELRGRVIELGLSARFRIHGHCDRDVLREMYGKSHVVIAPTHTDFLEGFNKVVVEGVLAGRPVVTSSVCPSLSLVRDAVLEVAPDDVRGYGDAILRLYEDPALYARMADSAAVAREQFYDESHSWGMLLRVAIAGVQRGRSTVATPRATGNVNGVEAQQTVAARPLDAAAAATQSARRNGRSVGRRVQQAAAAPFSSYGGMVMAAALGVLAALLGFVGISNDHPVPIDGRRPAPRHLRWSKAEPDDVPVAQNPSSSATADPTAP